MRRFLLFVLFIINCASQSYVNIQPTFQQDTLKPIDSIFFQSQIRNSFVTNDGYIFLLDVSNEKIFKSNINHLLIIDTIILPQKINFLKGIVADNFFIYLYSDNSLIRYDPISQRFWTIIDWQDKVNIYDVAITNQGEIFISDNINNQILLRNSLEKIVKFNLTIKDLFIPIGIYYDDNNSELYVINKAQNRLEILSRIGNVKLTAKLPVLNCSNIAVNKDKILVWAKNQNKLFYQIIGKSDWHQITLNQSINNIAFYNNYLLALDNTKGIYIYKIY